MRPAETVLIAMLLLSGCATRSKAAVHSSTGPTATSAPVASPEVLERRKHDLIATTAYIYGFAVANGDVEVVKALIWSEGDSNRQFADAKARQLIASSALAQSLEAKFDGGRPGPGIMETFGLKPLDIFGMVIAEWDIDDATATPRKPGLDILPVTLRRINGIWRIDVTAQGTSGSMDQQGRDLRQQAEAIESISKKVKQGQFRDPAEVSAALERAGIQPVKRPPPPPSPKKPGVM